MLTVSVLTVSVLTGCSNDRHAPQPVGPYEAGAQHVSFSVGGIQRTAVLVVPPELLQDGAPPAPLVFAFHGHGGSGAGIQRSTHLENLWPAAIVVYPDGLPGHRGITDSDGSEPGWQTEVGELGDRDLAFFDTMLATIQANLPVDRGAVYLFGHSNGSQFVSLLLNQRGNAIAATANVSAAPPLRLLATDPDRSMFVSLGMNDPLVDYDIQKLAIPRIEEKLGIDAAAQPGSSGDAGNQYLTIEHGRDGLELDTYIHPGGHAIPTDVPALAVAFFQRNRLQ